jgi:uncharacterized protein
MTARDASRFPSITPRVLAQSTLAAITPLLILIAAILLACFLAYFAALIFGDVISFRTVLKKSAQVFLLLSIFPAMFWLKLNKTDLGFAARHIFLKQIGQGFLLGFITLLPVFAALYLLGVDVVDTTKPWTGNWLAKKILVDLLLALLISVFEEPVFRGILLSGLRKKLSLESAIVLSAMYYAILHFLNTPTEIPTSQITSLSGFTLVGEAFRHLLKPEILSAFLSLCAVGIFLGLLRTRMPVSIGLCIGCHTCWVWQIKLSKSLFNVNPQSDYLFLVSGYDGVIGPLVTVWLVTAMLGYLVYMTTNGRTN